MRIRSLLGSNHLGVEGLQEAHRGCQSLQVCVSQAIALCICDGGKGGQGSRSGSSASQSLRPSHQLAPAQSTRQSADGCCIAQIHRTPQRPLSKAVGTGRRAVTYDRSRREARRWPADRPHTQTNIS
jgi:hypothetical protein